MLASPSAVGCWFPPFSREEYSWPPWIGVEISDFTECAEFGMGRVFRASRTSGKPVVGLVVLYDDDC